MFAAVMPLAMVSAGATKVTGTLLGRASRWKPASSEITLARASAVVMLLFTERYFRQCARRVGLPAWRGPDTAGSIILRGLLAAASRRRAKREIARIETAFLECASAS